MGVFTLYQFLLKVQWYWTSHWVRYNGINNELEECEGKKDFQMRTELALTLPLALSVCVCVFLRFLSYLWSSEIIFEGSQWHIKDIYCKT